MATRPQRIILEEGIAAWDGDIDALFGLIYDAPFPMHVEDDITAANSNFPPASYEDCLLLIGTAGARRLYTSTGSAWVLYDKVSANVPDSTATTTADMASDFNDLLAALQAAGIMASS
jgi:hypothetical protein